MYNLLTTIGTHINAGLVVACGDNVIHLDSTEVSLPDAFDVTGVTYWGTPKLGQRHDVYDTAPHTYEVRRCLQKVSAGRLKEEGVHNADGRVAIDTGILIFRPTAVSRLRELARLLPEHAYVDLYGEVLPAMALQTDVHCFTRERTAVRRTLWEKLHSLRLGIWCPAELEFMHTGTTHEYLELLKRLEYEPRISSQSDA